MNFSSVCLFVSIYEKNGHHELGCLFQMILLNCLLGFCQTYPNVFLDFHWTHLHKEGQRCWHSWLLVQNYF